jgi:RNA:NAD 2'-phosphotransferase (TPT1/KptA family)
MKNTKTGQEWLWHGTPRENIEAIKKEGLKPNKMGFVSLTPKFKIAERYGCVFQVEVTNYRLTQFEGGEEILCWTDKPIPPELLQHTLGQA